MGAAIDAYGEVAVVRGTQTLRLSSRTAIEENGVLTDLCRLFAALTREDEPSRVARVLASAWPWTRALPEGSRVDFAFEVGPVIEMCESLGSYRALTDLLDDWKRTARAFAEGDAEPVVIDDPLGTPAVRPE